MATVISRPDFLSINDWRRVVKNNSEIHGIDFLLVTDQTWLPRIMAEAGFFESGSQCKKNRPDLWRDLVDGEWFSFGGWCRIRIRRVNYSLEDS